MAEGASYLATDLSGKMVEAGEERIRDSLKKFGSSLTYDQWCLKHNFSLKVANAEEEIAKDRKFDRIICNMVLMYT